MEARSIANIRYYSAVIIGLIVGSANSNAQELNDNITAISGSGSVFSALTHTRSDLDNTTESTTEPSVGVSGNLGGSLESGANSLAMQYGGTLETERALPQGEQSGAASFTGASRFAHADPGSRFDFNLGHTVSSVRNDTGFVINPSSYDTRNTLSAGAGVRFYPGELSTLRFSARAGRSFGADEFGGNKSVTAATELSRRLSERSELSLVGSRSWSDGGEEDTTLDSAQLVYSRALENGSFGVGGGASRSDTEYLAGSVSKSDAVTGFLQRSWVSQNARTAIQYNRRLSNSATDLSTGLPEFLDFLPDTVRLRETVVSDSVLINHNTSRLCDVCNLGLGAEATVFESQLTSSKTHEYRTSINLGFQLTSLYRLNFGYSWQGEAADDAGTIVEQIHRFNSRWTRRLAKDTSFSVEVSQTYLRSSLTDKDQDQFGLRLILARSFALTGR